METPDIEVLRRRASLNPLNEGHAFKLTVVEGVSARLLARAPSEFVSVKTSEDADRALQDPGNTHHCPLCDGFYGTFAFKAHIRGCVNAHAPAWEGQRDREPPHRKAGKKFRLLFGSNHGRKR